MTAATISTETVTQVQAPGTKANGTSGKYNPRNYLSDRAKVTEIDGSECDKSGYSHGGIDRADVFHSSWFDGLRGAWHCFLRKLNLDLLKHALT